MNNLNSIIEKKDYGKVEFHFKNVMDEQGINRNQLATRAGIRFEVADRFYKGNIERLDLDVLARICFVLNCEIEDVLEYRKDI